ncbi:MAG: hypothetical protein RLZZ440_1579 [Planctomycetota bacterium]|jgi:hypothetical protein
MAWSLVAAIGCSPQPGPGLTDDVIEIEEIEMAAPVREPTAAAGGSEARREVDAETAAADQAIDEAARSIEPPPSMPAAGPAAPTPPQPTADQ